MPEGVVTEEPVTGSLARFELVPWKTHGVIAGITARATADQIMDFTLDRLPLPAEGAHRWSRLASDLGVSGLVVAKQVHGVELAWHDAAGGLNILEAFDGHGTGDPDVGLAVTAADCIPVYLFDPVTRAAALLHAGWRGTARGVLAAGVEMLSRRAGAKVENLLMHCGPGICGVCYEVGSEVAEALDLPVHGPGPWRVDLRWVLGRQARALGMSRISMSSLCTKEAPQAFFSHRGSGGRPGRMVAYLRVLP